MIPGDTLLLCLVLCLGLGLLTHAAVCSHPHGQGPWFEPHSPLQGGFTNGEAGVPAPAPTISVSPGPVVPWNQSVRIWCRGPVSFLYHLELQRSPGSDPEVVGHTLGARKEAEFPLQRMDAGKAGSYRCRFQGPDGWSEHSEELQLVVTGFYDKPLLSPGGPLVARLGARLSLRCSSPHARFDGFSLAKEGGAPIPAPERDPRGATSPWAPWALAPLGTTAATAGSTAAALCGRSPARPCSWGSQMLAEGPMRWRTRCGWAWRGWCWRAWWACWPGTPGAPESPVQPAWRPQEQRAEWTFRPRPLGTTPP
ncbi:immunoglobulin alpha Fc receptor-like isoform X3 [Erinaceus europaeus]|uniref:immunoglobulin alpha Fc receptor-like isoform X3 n=1 Tax=Erinaceus europaeus TaxID=9365 RepID=UPI0028FCF687|nr:immunoglobulin alpha Fc receptor-like isoform X3 [Erinaceus europaeus]